MHTKLALLGSLLLLACSTACTQAPATPTATADTHDADVQAIKDTEAAWAKAAAAKDAEKFASFYTDDGSILLQDMPIVTGKEAIANTTKAMMGDPNFSLSFQGSKFDVPKSRHLGFSQGSYTMIMTSAKSKKAVTGKGKFLTVFKKQTNGTWKAVEDMVSSDGSAPAK